MFSVFNANLQIEMGKTIVRRHLTTSDAQSVWRELSEHMKTLSKGASEKRRLTQYVTNNRSLAYLHTSGCLMVDVPHLDHLWDGQKDWFRDKQIIWSM